jgi:hypothetical protein
VAADDLERRTRTQIAIRRGTAAMAAVDAVAPKVDDLAGWYHGDVNGVAESNEIRAQRVRNEAAAAVGGTMLGSGSVTVPPQKKESAVLTPFEMTPFAFMPSPDSPFSFPPVQASKEVSSSSATTPAAITGAAAAFSGFDCRETIHVGGRGCGTDCDDDSGCRLELELGLLIECDLHPTS